MQILNAPSSCALQLPRSLCVRLAKPGWRWSGAFQIQVHNCPYLPSININCRPYLTSKMQRSMIQRSYSLALSLGALDMNSKPTLVCTNLGGRLWAAAGRARRRHGHFAGGHFAVRRQLPVRGWRAQPPAALPHRQQVRVFCCGLGLCDPPPLCRSFRSKIGKGSDNTPSRVLTS